MLVKPVKQFDFNIPVLLREYNYALKTFPEVVRPEQPLIRLAVTTHPAEAQTTADMTGRNDKHDLCSVDYIVNHFQGSYIECAIREIDAWFQQQEFRVTRAKLSGLRPMSCARLHVDKNYIYPRYHVPLQVDDEFFMLFGTGEALRMSQLNMLYEMQANQVYHTPVNAGCNERVFITIDVKPQ